MTMVTRLMNSNYYAPPSANVDCAEPQSCAFYVVSKRKFLILNIATSGWYFTYWLYRNWKLYRNATGEKVLPLFRTILGVFFVYSLFMKIDRRMRVSGRNYRWHPRSLALGYILSVCASVAQVWIPQVRVSFLLSCLFLFFYTFFLLRVQGAINFLENDAGGLSNSTLTFANGVWIALGLGVWSLALYSVYLLSRV